MRKTVLVALIPSLFALAACTADPADTAAAAREAFAAHDYATARIKLASALTKHPDDADLRMMQVRTLLALGDGDGAEAAIAALSPGQPQGALAVLAAEAALLRKVPAVAMNLLGSDTSSEAERLRGLAAIQMDDFAKADRHFAIAAKDGRNVRALTDYARFKLIGGDAEGATALVASAAKLEADSLDVLLLQGQLAVRRGDLAGALASYNRANTAYPASLAALTGQAAVLGDLGRTGEMTVPLDRAAAQAPNDPTVKFLRAKLALINKDYAAVRALIEPVAPKLATSDPLRLVYGEALLRLGQTEQAMAAIRPVTRSANGNRRAVALLGETQLAAGDARSAVATLRPLANLPAPSPEELALLLKAAKAAGDTELAAVGAKLRAPAVQALAAELADADSAMRRSNWAGAAESYRRILAMTDGRNVLVLNNMAYAQLMLGNHAQANDYASRALQLAPDDPSVLDTAGWAQFKSGGNLAEARRLLRRAASLAPANPTIRRHLAEAEGRPG